MKHLLHCLGLWLVFLQACTPDRGPTCGPCTAAGRYTGQQHNTGGPYSGPLTTDTLVPVTFWVDTIAGDSLRIIRDYDLSEWRWAYNDSGRYTRSGGLTWGISFEFKAPDSLLYYYNNGGGGGYMREDFKGTKD